MEVQQIIVVLEYKFILIYIQISLFYNYLCLVGICPQNKER